MGNAINFAGKTVYDTPRIMMQHPASATGIGGYLGMSLLGNATGIPTPADFGVPDILGRSAYTLTGAKNDAHEFAQQGAMQGGLDMFDGYRNLGIADRMRIAFDPSKLGAQPQVNAGPFQNWDGKVPPPIAGGPFLVPRGLPQHNGFLGRIGEWLKEPGGVPEGEIRSQVSQGVNQKFAPYMQKFSSQQEQGKAEGLGVGKYMLSSLMASTPNIAYNKLFNHHVNSVADMSPDFMNWAKDTAYAHNPDIEVRAGTSSNFDPRDNHINLHSADKDTFFHELGHASMKPTPSQTKLKNFGARGLPNLLGFGMMGTESMNDPSKKEHADQMLATSGFLSNVPALTDEVLASRRGLNLAKVLAPEYKGAEGILGKMRTFKGLPSYAMNAAALPLFYGAKKLLGSYDSHPVEKQAGWGTGVKRVSSFLGSKFAPVKRGIKATSNAWKGVNPAIRMLVSTAAGLAPMAGFGALAYQGEKAKVKSTAYDQGYSSSQANAAQLYSKLPTWQRALAAVSPDLAAQYGMNHMGGGQENDMQGKSLLGPTTTMYQRDDGTQIF